MKPCWYCNSDGSSCEACDERRNLCADLADAADEIERMQAEIERLRTVIDTAHVHLLRGEGLQAINTLESPC